MGNNTSYRSGFKQFYEQQFDRVYVFLIHRTRNREDARDLTHDVFMKALHNWPRLREATHQEAYLFSIVRTLLIDYYRKAVRETHQLSDLSESHLPTQEPAEPHPQADYLALLHQAIETLPEQRREIFKLKKLQGLSTEEVAQALSLSTRTVENQVYRAMLTLRKQLTHFW